jgi:thioredoxin-related protein
MLKLRSLLALLILPLFLMSADNWRTDFDVARADAKKEHKLILLKFSGSDWCVPCIRMEKEVFSTETFQQFASTSLITVNADFPQRGLAKMPKALIQQNEKLAEQYNKEGHFPYTVLLDPDGKVLKTWDGYKGMKPEELIAQVKPNVAL